MGWTLAWFLWGSVTILIRQILKAFFLSVNKPKLNHTSWSIRHQEVQVYEKRNRFKICPAGV
jgi:hypothetical protein